MEVLSLEAVSSHLPHDSPAASFVRQPLDSSSSTSASSSQRSSRISAQKHHSISYSYSVPSVPSSVSSFPSMLPPPARPALSPASDLPPVPSTKDHLANTAEHDNFLTLIATQERRVLELKEELGKAEGDLEKLKKQWAVHEARKKREEALVRGRGGSRQLQQVRTLNGGVLSKEGGLGLGLGLEVGGDWEMEKRDRIIRRSESMRQQQQQSQQQHSQRRVFQGSRHTKTLSLLSPKPLVDQELQALRSPTASSNDHHHHHHSSETSLPPTSTTRLSRVETTPNLLPPLLPTKDTHTTSVIPSPATSPTKSKEDILHPAKQLVGDFREGLWTFFEDLRQATVGDDYISSASDSRHPHHHHLNSEGKRSSGIKNTMRRPSSPSKSKARNDHALPKIAPQQPVGIGVGDGERRTRARRTSSKNEGYAFKLEAVLAEKKEEEADGDGGESGAKPSDAHCVARRDVPPRRESTAETTLQLQPSNCLIPPHPPERVVDKHENQDDRKDDHDHDNVIDDPDNWVNWDLPSSSSSPPPVHAAARTTTPQRPRPFSGSSSGGSSSGDGGGGSDSSSSGGRRISTNGSSPSSLASPTDTGDSNSSTKEVIY